MHSPTATLTAARNRPQFGFTAIELMVVVSIVAVLAALAGPSFTPLMERWRVRSATEDLASTLYFARSEAIKRGGGITIAASGGWNSGWKVTHTQDSITTDLQSSPKPNRVSIAQNNNKNKLYIDRWGMLSETNGGIPMNTNVLIYPEGKSTTDSSAVRLCVSGARITQMKNGGACS